MLIYLILQAFAVLLGTASVILIILWSGLGASIIGALKNLSPRAWIAIAILGAACGIYTYATHPYPVHFALPPWMQSKAPGQMPASLPINKIITFFKQLNRFEQVADIGADPNAVPDMVKADADGIVRIEMMAQEVIGEVGDGVFFNYWTYNGQAPGPMYRVREGDTVEVALTNHPSSLHPHNIDFHAVNGPGGGATLSRVLPGETKTFRWKALNPGLYVYHCATANVSTHNAHGQYGLILVEPKEGLPPVDKEFYIVQGELYTVGGIGTKGLVAFDPDGLLDGIPTYITFNGKLEEEPRMKASVGDKVRMYVGNGGTNLISSFHVIGEIFDVVYPEASIGPPPFENVQTTAVLPGGAAIVEFTLDVPGNYILVDHALARMNKGAWAVLEVDGPDNPEIYGPAGNGERSVYGQ